MKLIPFSTQIFVTPKNQLTRQTDEFLINLFRRYLREIVEYPNFFPCEIQLCDIRYNTKRKIDGANSYLFDLTLAVFNETYKNTGIIHDPYLIEFIWSAFETNRKDYRWVFKDKIWVKEQFDCEWVSFAGIPIEDIKTSIAME